MVNVITDLAQSAAIIIGAVFMILLVRRQARLEHKVTRAQLKPPEDPKPICGCDHHQCFHDENGCAAIDYMDGYTYNTECGCKRYTGPEALPTVLP